MGNCISHAPRPRTPEQEKNEVSVAMAEVERIGYRHGQTWNVISAKWWRTWKEYSGYSEADEDEHIGGGSAAAAAAAGRAASAKRNSVGLDHDEDEDEEDDDEESRARPPPGQINNNDLCIAGFPAPMELRRDLNEAEDYALIPGHVYELLERWYGGGPSLERTIVKVSDGFSVDLFPLRVEIVWATAQGLEPPGVAWSSGNIQPTQNHNQQSLSVADKANEIRSGGAGDPRSQQLATQPNSMHFLHSDPLEHFYDELLKLATGGRDPTLARLWVKQGESLSTPVGAADSGAADSSSSAANNGGKQGGGGDGWVLLKLRAGQQQRRQRLDIVFEECDVVRVLVEKKAKLADKFPRQQAGKGGTSGAGGAGSGGKKKGRGADSESKEGFGDEDDEDDEDGDEDDDDDDDDEEGGAEEVDPRWREDLRVGSMLDALDSDMRWFDAKVVDERAENDSGQRCDELRVHYMGWTAKWDVWVDRYDAERTAPLHAHTEDWRASLGVGDEIEVSDKVFTQSRRNTWHPGTIRKVRVERTGERKAMIRVESGEYDDAWVSMRDELVCCLGTHTKKPKSNLPSSSASGGGGSGGGGGGAVSTPGGGSGSGSSGGGNASSSSSSSYSYGGYSPWSRGSVSGDPVAVGAVGLSNLGNTCFMNSMLQCLFQTASLTDFFLEGQHKKDVNRSNLLGTGGRLALEYAALLKKLWSGSYSTVVPKEFKSILGRAAPQFAGYQQQDSQEFMSFLLDGIHEDLNRVSDKPYTEAVEGGDGKRTDDEVATEAWRRHLLRNDSVVVDKCQGLLRSHLTCPRCNHQSVTFDPYMSLSLPLPSARNVRGGRVRKIWVTVVPAAAAGSLMPRAIELAVPMNGTIADLRQAVLEASSKALEGGGDADGGEGGGGRLLSDHSVNEQLHPSRLKVCDMWNHRVYKVYKSNERLVEIRASDETYIYEVAHAPQRSSSSSSSFSTPSRSSSSSGGGAVRYCDVLMAREGSGGGAGGGSGRGASSGKVSSAVPEVFGAPWHFSYNGSTTVGEVRAALARHCARMTADGGGGGGGRGGGAPLPYRVVVSDCEGKDLGAELPGAGSGAAGGGVAVSSGGGGGGGGLDEKGGRQPFVEWLEAAAAAGPSSLSPGQSGGRSRSKSASQLARAVTVLWGGDARLSREGQEGWKKKAPTRQGNGANGMRGMGRNGNGGDVVQLMDCLKLFTEKEQLGENDLWYCPKCKDHVPAFKKFDLWTVPDVLIIHLKRFEYIPGQYFMAREKIESLVNFPVQNLDLREYCKGGAVGGAGAQYDLYAVSEHMGTQHGGHYTAVVKNYRNSRWYSCNDSSVSESQAEAGVTPNAYVLFYQRRGAGARWGGMKKSTGAGFEKDAKQAATKGGKPSASGRKSR